MKNCAFFFLLVFPLFARAQRDSFPFRPGLLLDARSFRAYPLYPAGERGGISGLEVDLRPYCPSAGEQGRQASCVGFAIAQALTIRLAYSKNKTRRTDSLWIEAHRFSPSFIFNQIKADPVRCDSGAFFHYALEWIVRNGVCLLSDFSYDSTDCRRMPDRELKQQARQNSLDKFEVVVLPGMEADSVCGRVMTALDNGNPVVVALRIKPNFFSVDAQPCTWVPFAPPGTEETFHALVVVGYDDTSEAARKFLLFNSFGAGWGCNGFAEISFRDFARQVEYGVVLTPGW